METLIVSIICVALMVVGGMTMSRGLLTSVDTTSTNIVEISQRDEDIMRTGIVPLSAVQTAPETVTLNIHNTGQTKLANFNKWDVIVHYYDHTGVYHITWLPYTSEELGDNEWTMNQIYQDITMTSLESFDPGLLNSEEVMIIECKLNPAVGPETANKIVVSTPNGISIEKVFPGFKE